MSRRPPNPGAERAAANQATLKTLVKLESNKSCADCKRNKHPRWASWNLGIFICIRCSGIHRGMGTHISRVKSVDLDAWTDEQLASMVKWGNARANKYWEAKLAPGHQPSEGKMENFIRTKYDSKRWVMDGGMPDPSTLGADDEVPLSVVQGQAKVQRAGSLRTTGGAAAGPAKKAVSDIDLFGDVPEAPAPRSSSAQPQVTAKVSAPPAARKGGDSLLGFDFFNGSSSNPPSRPSSAAPGAPATTAAASPGMPSRPDLKQSILSLYASAPKTAPPATEQPAAATSQAPKQSGLGSLNDDFGGLSFGGSSTQPSVTSPTSAFSSVASPAAQSIKSQPVTSARQSTSSAGGSFFDSKPAVSKPTTKPAANFGGDFDDFGGFEGVSSPPPITSATTSAPKKAAVSTGNGLDDLFDFSEPAAAAPVPASKPSTADSPFNLSAPKQSSTSNTATSKAPPPVSAANFMSDPWGSSDDVWASNPGPPTPAAGPTASSFSQPAAKSSASVAAASPMNDWGDDWGTRASAAPRPAATSSSKPAPHITADEDFGGWESSAQAVSPAPLTSSRPANGGAGGASAAAPKPFVASDAFDNPWE